MKTNLLIYGAYGYTGKLICEIANQYNLQPILAGRSQEKLKAMSMQTGFPFRTFSLDNVADIAAQLQDVKVVMHAAGPFAFTAENMLEACLQTGTHYLDITGEIGVFEMAAGMNDKAVAANIMLMPGTGFDVVPTDCLSLTLKQQMPDATHLQIAFGSRGGGISHGTATSMVNKLGTGGAERINGALVTKPLGHKCLEIAVDGFQMFTMSIPWGDLSTAWRTTGIPNITTYTRVGKNVYRVMKAQLLFNWLLRTSLMKKWLQQKIDARPEGPSADQRKKSRSYIWGKVTNVKGMSVCASFTAPESYMLTAQTACLIAQKVMQNNWKPGYQTPAGCYGAGLVFELEGLGALSIDG